MERSNMLRRITEVGGDVSSNERVAMLHFGLAGALERPILGWGPENYLVVWGKHYEAAKSAGSRLHVIQDRAHNNIVETLTASGIVGLISYLALWGSLIWVLFARVRRRGADRHMLTAFIGSAAVGLFVMNLTAFDTPASLLQSALLIGFAVSTETNRERNPAASPFQLRRLHRAVLAVGVIAILVVTVYSINIRAYQAASEAWIGDLTPATEIGTRLHHLNRAINLFPPLANTPRRDMLSALAEDWNALGSLSEQKAAISLIKRIEQDLAASGGEHWLNYFLLGLVYQNAVSYTHLTLPTTPYV